MRLNNKITEARNQFVIQKYKANPMITGLEVQELVKQEFGFGMSASTLQKLKVKAFGDRIINYRIKEEDFAPVPESVLEDMDPKNEVQVHTELRNNHSAMVDQDGNVICITE